MTVLGLVLGLPAEADPRHDIVMSKTPPVLLLRFFPNAHLSSTGTYQGDAHSPQTLISAAQLSVKFIDFFVPLPPLPLSFAYFPSFSSESFLMFSSYLCTSICTGCPFRSFYLKKKYIGALVVTQRPRFGYLPIIAKDAAEARILILHVS